MRVASGVPADVFPNARVAIEMVRRAAAVLRVGPPPCDARPGVARDEYDCMVGPSLRMLEGGASDAQIAEYLHGEMTDHFGLPGDLQGWSTFAKRLTAWFEQRSR